MKRISSRQGKIFENGEQVQDGVSVSLNMELETSRKGSLGTMKKSTKVLGYNMILEITRFKQDQNIRRIVESIRDTGAAPDLAMTIIVDDKASSYFEQYGAEKIQCTELVPTGTIPILSQSQDGEEVQETLVFDVGEVKWL